MPLSEAAGQIWSFNVGLQPKPGQIAAKTNRALSRAFTEGDDERIGFDDQPGPVRIVAANAQASPCLGSEDFNDPEPRWAREQQSLMLHFCFLIDGVEFCIHGPGFA